MRLKVRGSERVHHESWLAAGAVPPNPSVQRTAPGVPGSAAYLKRWAS